MKRLKVEEFATTITGGTPSTKVSDYWDNGEIPWLNSGALNQSIVTQCSKFITPLGLKKSSAKLMPPDTVLIALTGATTGTVGYLTFEACGNQSVTGILPSDIHRPKYLFYFLKSIRKKIDKDATGTAQPGINQRYVRNLKVPIPSIQEQKEIIEILDQAFESTEKAKANAEQNLQNAKDFFESYLQNVFSTIGDNWEMKTIGDIGKPSMCKRILKRQTSTHGDIPFYKIGTFGKVPNAYISKELYEEYKSKYSFPKKGDVLISASGTIGRTVIYDGEPAFFQDSNIVWIDNDEKQVLNEYLYNFYGFCDWQPSKGATISRLYNSNLKRIKIMFPKSLQEQRTVIKKINAISKETKKLEAIYTQKIANLEEMKKSILQKAFSGELTNKTV